jgi:t-SNARE complex subunit (syntaxin)
MNKTLNELKKTKGRNCAEFRIRNMQYSMLLKKFMEIMGQYNLIQVDYRERCKDRIKRQLEISE